MSDGAVDLLVTKDSGGAHTSAKLDAAADLRVPVLVIARPLGDPGTESVATVAAAVEWVERTVRF